MVFLMWRHVFLFNFKRNNILQDFRKEGELDESAKAAAADKDAVAAVTESAANLDIAVCRLRGLVAGEVLYIPLYY